MSESIFDNFSNKVNEVTESIDDYNKLLGRTLLQPYKPANSGSRALMSNVHSEQHLALANPEMPLVQTGFEYQFGENSSSFIKAKGNYKVIAKVDKYLFKPGFHYYLIVQDIDTGIYDVIERLSYNHNTEVYGYLWNNKYLDNLKVNDVIKKEDVIKCSNGFDEYGNKYNGTNLLTVYMSSLKNSEDSMILSESGAKKLATNLIKTVYIAINDNDVLCDRHGVGNTFKAFKDVGEVIDDNIFCSIRRMENETILYTLSRSRSREPMISDRNILFNGLVVDIDVLCNNPESLKESYYNQQLYFYHTEKVRFCREIYDVVAPLVMNGKISYELEVLFADCRDSINGKQYFKDNQFNNVLMKVSVVEPKPMQVGDKMVDRYGGKGVVSYILPDELMPVLDDGRTVDCIKNQSTCINRENIGQLHEQSINFIASRILDFWKVGVLSDIDKFNMWYEFMSIASPSEAEFGRSAIDIYDPVQLRGFIDMIESDGKIIISDNPFTTIVNIDTIAELYRRLPFIKKYKVMTTIEDSNGVVRQVPTKRELVAANIYHYRLKQYGEEKFSATSLPATNLKNLNTRSRANKMYEVKYTKTPIMFGPMESVDMGHIGIKYVVMNLMLYSTSPQARKLFEQLLIGDPYDIDIKLDKDSKNRNAEIINALLGTMGLELVFNKVLKKKKEMCKYIMCTDLNNKKEENTNNESLCKYIMCDYIEEKEEKK